MYLYRKLVPFLLLISGYHVIELSTARSTTLNVKQRVAILKKQLLNEIRAKQESILPVEDDSYEDDDYENHNGPITPIMFRPKKIRIKTKKFSTMTTTAVKTPAIIKPVKASTPFSQKRTEETKSNDEKPKNVPVKLSSLRSMSKNISQRMLRKPVDIFYRRNFVESMMTSEIQWAHCQDMITPYLTGVKKDLTHPKHLSTNSPVVARFIQLLNVNTTLYTKEDIYSVLYQISNLQLRLFQWDVPALNLLFRMLISDTHHTFGNLKHGIREQFAEWRLDISNITNLLQQARIFRPPCVAITDSTGSTKSNKVSKYPKKTKATTVCESDEDFECKYRQ